MTNQLLFALGLYITTLFAISFIFYYRTKNASSFMVGNRSLNYWVAAISAQASDMGPWLFLGYPATVFMRGSFEIWTALGLIFFMFLTWQFVAPAIRKATEEYNALTLWTYFEKRYNDTSGYLRALSASIAILFFVFYIASGLVSLGRIFEASFGMAYTYGVLIAAIATCAYIMIGGFLAVAWCNLFQGLFLLAMILIVPIAAYIKLDSTFDIIHNAHLREISLSLFPSFGAFWQGLLLFAGWGLGYFGQPHIIVNFMAIDDANNIRYAKWVGLVWQTIALGASVAIGIIGIGLYSFRLENHEALFPTMINDLFSPFVVGFILCGVFAAALSSITAQLLVAASSATEDLYKKILFPHAGTVQLVWISKLAIVIIGTISTVLALLNTDTIYNLVFYAWSGLGCAFGPLMLLSLHSTYINKAGAYAAIITGTTVALGLPYIAPGVPSLVVGFTLSTLSAYAATALTRNRAFNV